LFVCCGIFVLAVLCAAILTAARLMWSSEGLVYSSVNAAVAGTEQCSFDFLQKDVPRINFTLAAFRTAAGSDYHCSYDAVLNLAPRPDSSSLCLVSGTRQSDCFQPALIFCMIPRGPPISQMRPFYKTLGV
jgi:hypothetical protein